MAVDSTDKIVVSCAGRGLPEVWCWHPCGWHEQGMGNAYSIQMNLLKFTVYHFLVVTPGPGVKPVQLVSSSILLTFLVSCLGKPQNTAKNIFFQGGELFWAE